MATPTDPLAARGRVFGALLGALLPATLAAQATDTPAAPAPTALMGDAARGAQWRWVEDWTDPVGSTHGCMVVDGKGRILVNTETEAAVTVLSPDGERVAAFGAEFKGGLHGMTLRVEAGKEVLYLAHTARHEVVKMTIDGEVLWTIGVPTEAGIYEKDGQYKPTAVAVAPDGRVFVGDGYGLSWVHVYDSRQQYVKSFGGRGDDDGKFKAPHGLWLDDRGDAPLLLVCDRENHRLQWFTLDGEFVRKVSDGMRRPCNVWPLRGHGMDGWLAVADLTGCVTILDADDAVVTVLGDNAPKDLRATNRVDREHWLVGRFFAPHSVCQDGTGALYVMDWNRSGRISKLELVAGGK